MNERFTKTRDAARGKWKGILMHFGIDESFLKNEHGPCPLCKGKDRFRWDDRDGDGTYYCSHCEPGTGMRLLMAARNWPFSKAAAEVDRILNNIPMAGRPVRGGDQGKRIVMRRMFRESRPVSPGDPVWRYLESRCGDPSGLLGDIRFHPGLAHSLNGGLHPVMLALMWPHGEPKACGIHRTYLTPDGHKAGVDPVRMSYGELASVRLGPAMERMGIAEGIETAICAGKLFGIPVWAAISANGLRCWEPPASARTVVIFGDNDSNFVGQLAAFENAKLLRSKGLNVEIQIPQLVDTDWCDVWHCSQQQEVG